MFRKTVLMISTAFIMVSEMPFANAVENNPFLPPEHLTRSQEDMIKEIVTQQMGTSLKALREELKPSQQEAVEVKADDQTKSLIQKLIKEELTKGVGDFIPQVNPNGSSPKPGVPPVAGGVPEKPESMGTFIGCVDGKAIYKDNGKMKKIDNTGECR